MAGLYRDGATPPPDAAYPLHRTARPADALLAGDETVWAPVPRLSWGPDAYRAMFRALWDETALWARFDVRDDRPWHTRTHRDDHLWEEEVVEIFLDPTGRGRDYAEVEISPANVVCDLIVRSPWPALDSDPEWVWDGLESRVAIAAPDAEGHVCWTALARLPWDGLRSLGPDAAARIVPREGDAWRVNVFRIKRPHGPAAPEQDVVYAGWSVPAGPSFHDPAAFRALTFCGPLPSWR
jgi:hypothetical protein